MKALQMYVCVCVYVLCGYLRLVLLRMRGLPLLFCCHWGVASHCIAMRVLTTV